MGALSVSAQRTRLDVHTDNDNDTHSGKLNVYGAPLKKCSGPGMALTGFTREGTCTDRVDDAGSHHICIEMDSVDGGNFCEVTGQPNWCDDYMQCDGKRGLCPVQHWCVCEWAFASYITRAGGCNKIQSIDCEATNRWAYLHYQQKGMALTGFTREGTCTDRVDDAGSHHICIEMDSVDGGNFCEVTGQPNWCDDYMQCDGKRGLCPVQHWCVREWAFASYITRAGGCEKIQSIESRC